MHIVRSCFLPFILLFTSNSSAQDIFDKEHTWQFARYLYSRGEYSSAAMEFERLHFIDPANDSVKYYLVRSYRFSNQCFTGIKRINQWYTSYDKVPSFLIKDYSLNLLCEELYPELDSLFIYNIYIAEKHKIQLTTLSQLKQGNWNYACELYCVNSKLFKDDPQYSSIFIDIGDYKPKSPFLAGMMSTALPGSGKIYTGYWKDGLFSFSTLALAGWQSYNGFQRDGRKSIYGWVFAGLSTVLYVSNIYGSQKSARMRNNRIKNEIYNKIDNLISSY